MRSRTRSVRRFARAKRGDRGIALITAIWLSVIGVMLVTTLATIVTGNIILATNISAESKARMGAEAGINKVIAELIADRPTAVLDTPGIIITEVGNSPTDYCRDALDLYDTTKNARSWKTGGAKFDTSFEFCNPEAGGDTLWTEIGTSSAINIDNSPTYGACHGDSVLSFTTPTTVYTGRGIISCSVAVRSLDKNFNDVRTSAALDWNDSWARGPDTVNFGCWVFIPQPGTTDPAANAQIEISVIFYDSKGNTLGSAIIDKNIDSNQAWIKYESRCVKVPYIKDSEVRARLQIRVKEIGILDPTIYIDNAFISWGAMNPTTTRRYEYIEIQNCDSIAHNLVTENYWICVDSALLSGDTRYIYPIAFKNNRSCTGDFDVDSSLQVGAVGVIIPEDADTVAIAALSGKKPSAIKWFGLRSGSGATMEFSIGRASTNSMLSDTAETVIIGYGTVPRTLAPYWFGVPTPDSGQPWKDSSWQKSSYKSTDLDDTIDNATGTPLWFANLCDSTWTRVAPSPGIGIVTTVRSGVDGAIDTWYAFNFDSYALLDTSSYDIYYRTRVFDEGSKVNINYLKHKPKTSWESVVLMNLLLEQTAPAFKTNTSYWNAGAAGTGSIWKTDRGPLNAACMVDSLFSTRWVGSSGSDSLLTPNSAFLLFGSNLLADGTDATPGAGLRGWGTNKNYFDSAYIPFVSIYGYNEAFVFPINMNMAETPVMRAALIWALIGNFRNTDSVGSPYATSGTIGGWQTCVDSCRLLADSIVRYLTKFDTAASNDTVFYRESDILKAIAGANDRAQVQWAINNNRITSIFSTASTNYFTIYSTGFAYKKGSNTATETPAAQARIMAVVRRYTDADKAEIIYWREIWELATADKIKATFAVGTHRYPRYRWDSSQ